MSARPSLIVGLGNPGKEYENTRHNVGFNVLDRLAKELACSFKKKWRFSAEIADARFDERKIVLVKPRTYMNRSGIAIQPVLKWLNLSTRDMLVVVDDVDLPLGGVRVRSSGGSGGHNGLKSIVNVLGGREDFARLRIGIGRNQPVGNDVSGHVLGPFSRGEQQIVEKVLEIAVQAALYCVKCGVEAAMNEFNGKLVG